MTFVKRSASINSLDVTDLPKQGKITGKECFQFSPDVFQDLTKSFNEKEVVLGRLAQLGGVQGLAFGLFTNLQNGLDDPNMKDRELAVVERFPHRVAAYGENVFSQPPPTSFWELCLEALDDAMLKLLIVAGLVNVVIGLIDDPEHGWIEGIAVLLAVTIVTLVSAINDMAKEKKFREMDQQNQIKVCHVIRNGKEKEVSNVDLVVGDIVLLKSGSEVPVDGFFVSGTDDLAVDESALTGESIEVKKSFKDPLLLSGTAVSSGNGSMIAISVGDRSYQGQMLLSLMEKREDTPLQKKLTILGSQIGYFGGGTAILLFLVLTIVWAVTDGSDPTEVLTYFIIAVTIVVVAVPEGLPLAVTLSLAYSMNKMMDDNNFVRVLAACETMGNATTICSDKTGTLTTNQMTVVKALINLEIVTGVKATNLTKNLLSLLHRCIVVNSEASLQEDPKTGCKRLSGANQTECALLRFAMDLGVKDLDSIRNAEENAVLKFYPFHSKMKRSSVLLKHSNDSFTMFVKGAAERILQLCNAYYDADGNIHPMGDLERAKVVGAMDAMAKTGLRCLGMAVKSYTDMAYDEDGKVVDDPEEVPEFWEGFVWLTVCGIKDPVRAEVPRAVKRVQEAGVVVRMVTGDHLETAKFIARECGILTNDNHVCMTGVEFRSMTDAEREERLPMLRVLARSNPQDKECLVNWYREDHQVRRNGEVVLDKAGEPLIRPGDVVAVTGDGANDALALKSAHVGLSMGIQGTDVAKRASDIVIMDDNFASIVKTVMWGRSVFDNIRKFVQFQLTVNVVALCLALFAPITGKATQTPLTAVQLLWVNLIMDTLAALALATERPTEELLERHPYKPDSHLISPKMWSFVFGHAAFQLPILFVLLVHADKWFDNPPEGDNLDHDGRNAVHLTVVFNAFVWFQIFNEVNARRVNGEWNVFSNFFANMYFPIILVITAGLQCFIVYCGDEFTSTRDLDVEEWFFCVGLGSTVMIAHQFVRLIPADPYHGCVQIDTEREFGRDPKYALEVAPSQSMPTNDKAATDEAEPLK